MPDSTNVIACNARKIVEKSIQLAETQTQALALVVNNGQHCNR